MFCVAFVSAILRNLQEEVYRSAKKWLDDLPVISKVSGSTDFDLLTCLCAAGYQFYNVTVCY